MNESLVAACESSSEQSELSTGATPCRSAPSRPSPAATRSSRVGQMDIEQTPVPTYEDYLERAEEYLNTYKRLERQGLFDWARYLMIGHAVEVALKAYLLPRGWTMQGL